MHMPGHKGEGFPLSYSHDITEIDGADVLYSPKGIIRESERAAEGLFGTCRTVYSTEGSSLSVRAMLALTVLYAGEVGERPLILAARNAHKSFLSSAALLDFDVEWIMGESLISSTVTPSALEVCLDKMTKKPTAVYVTSPDYLGCVSDISGLSRVCHERGVLLLVDNAHGAYLKFLPSDLHPITLGADACCDSAHKTLPCLTGGGYLHISGCAPRVFSERADEMMALFASTSPSYLILESLDLTNLYLSGGFSDKLAAFLKVIDSTKARLAAHGWSVMDTEPMKITLATKPYGYTGTEVGEYLFSRGIVSEFSDPDFLTLMLSAEFPREVLDNLADALISLKRREAITQGAPLAPTAPRIMSPREATFAQTELLPVGKCEGRVLAAASVSCPPAVPVLISGELITADAVRALRYYGIEEVRVVK